MNRETNIIEEKKIPNNRNLYIAFAVISFLIIIWIRITNDVGIFIKEDTMKADVVFGMSIKVRDAFGIGAWIFFFTNISNILFCIVTTVRIFYRKKMFADHLQIIIGVYMILVGLIYWTLIGPFELKNRASDSFLGPDYLGEFIFSNLLIHGVTVVMATILIFKGIDRTKTSYITLMKYGSIFPIFYYIMAWILYLITWKLSANHNPVYIYGFLDFFHPFKIKSAALAVVMDILVFLGMFGIIFGMFYGVTKIPQFDCHIKKKCWFNKKH